MQPSAPGRLRAAAPVRAQIQNSRFKIQNYQIGLQLAKGHQLRRGAAGLRRPQAAARCGSIRNRKFMIQNSIFKIKQIFRTHLGIYPVSGHSRAEALARADLRDASMQSSARGRLRAAGPDGPILLVTISTTTGSHNPPISARQNLPHPSRRPNQSPQPPLPNSESSFSRSYK